MITITQVDLEALLCRPLTPCESTKFTLYLEIVKTQLESALCWNPFIGGLGIREFEYTSNDKIYLLPPFTGLVSVSISDCNSDSFQDIACDWLPVNKNSVQPLNGECAFGLLRCTCNTCDSIECCSDGCRKLKIEADWSNCPMDDLKLVALSMLKQYIVNSDCDDNIESKSIRSMTITYRDQKTTDYIEEYSSVISKWSICHADIG